MATKATTITKDNENAGILLSRRGLVSGTASLAGAAALLSAATTKAQASADEENVLLSEFRQTLQRVQDAAQIAFEKNTAKRPIDQAVGLLHVLDNLALGLAFQLHRNDPLHPELFRYMGPDRKQGGDNADALYIGFAVDAAHTYRLYGNRGSAKYLSITTVERGASPFGGAMGEALYGQDLKSDADGNFEVIFSAEPHEGNWVKLSPKDFRITIRQFFADWDNERPLQGRVELVGETPAPRQLTVEDIRKGIKDTGDWIVNTVSFWQDTMNLWRKSPNKFMDWRGQTGDGVNATPGGDVAIAHWQVPEGKALILRTRPPECLYWNIEFNNPWWETMDYVERLSGTNMHHAVLEDDGELVVVIAHKDPGVPNWLDTSGFTEGMMGRRWMFTKTSPEVKFSLVSHDDLFGHLPKNVKRIDAEGRHKQLETRRRGIYNRFNWL